MSDPKDKKKRPVDPFGIGLLSDGTLNIVPEGELEERIAARDADEEEGGEPGDVDTLASEYSDRLDADPSE